MDKKTDAIVRNELSRFFVSKTNVIINIALFIFESNNLGMAFVVIVFVAFVVIVIFVVFVVIVVFISF